MCKSRLYKTDRVETSNEFGGGTTYYPCVVERSDGRAVLAIFTGDQIRDAVERAQTKMSSEGETSKKLEAAFSHVT